MPYNPGVITAVLLATLAWPKNLTDSAAGLSVESRQLMQACWHDSNSGWYALKTTECDGAHVAVTITKDRHIIEDAGYDVPNFGKGMDEFYGPNRIEERTFTPKTKNNISVGSTAAQITKALGKPKTQFRDGARGQFTVLSYLSVHMVDKENGTSLENQYVLKDGKVIEIRIYREAIPGC